MAKGEMDKQPCKTCGKETNQVFNIGFKAVPICNSCANTIAMQQLGWLIEHQAT